MHTFVLTILTQKIIGFIANKSKMLFEMSSQLSQTTKSRLEVFWGREPSERESTKTRHVIIYEKFIIIIPLLTTD